MVFCEPVHVHVVQHNESVNPNQHIVSQLSKRIVPSPRFPSRTPTWFSTAPDTASPNRLADELSRLAGDGYGNMQLCINDHRWTDGPRCSKDMPYFFFKMLVPRSVVCFWHQSFNTKMDLQLQILKESEQVDQGKWWMSRFPTIAHVSCISPKNVPLAFNNDLSHSSKLLELDFLYFDPPSNKSIGHLPKASHLGPIYCCECVNETWHSLIMSSLSI